MALKFLNNGYFAGKVGIGTESPDRKLHVKDSAIVVSEFEGTNTGSLLDLVNSNASQLYNGIRFTQGASGKMAITHIADGTTKGYVQIGNSWATGSEILVVDGRTSSVGIGTTSPIELLHLYGGVGNPTRIRLQADDGQDDVLTFHQSTTQKGAVGYDDSDDVVSLTYGGLSGTTGIKINSSGNVGIGTTNPSSRLEIKATSATHKLVSINRPSSDTAALYIGNDSASPSNGIISSNYSDLIFGRDQSSTLSEWMRIKRDGNVGIGTTSPNDILQVNQGSAAFRGITIEGTSPALYLKDTQATNAYHIGSNGNYLYFLEDSNQSGGYNNIMAFWDPSNNFIFSLGNVGIGTSAPSQKLHVAGNARVTGAYYDSNNSPGTANQVLVSTVTGTDWIDGSAIPGVPGGSGTVNTIPLWTPDGDTLGNSLISQVTTSNVLMKGAGDNFILSLDPNNNAISDTSTVMFNDRARVGWFNSAVYLGDNGSNKDIKLQTNLGDIISLTSNTERMRIKYDTGNVGIGNTNPPQKLTVNGAAFITNGLTSPGAAGAYTYNATAIDYFSDGARYWSWGGATTRGTFDFIQLENDGQNQQTALSIDVDGNVGIGTTGPGQKLDVSGNIASNSIYLYDSTSNDRLVLDLDGSDNLQISTGTSTGFRGITFFTENSEKMRILSGGNVGIGTTSPTQKLHVSNGKVLVDVTSSVGTELILQNLAVDQFAADKNYHEINFITSSTSSETTGGYVRIKAGQEISGNDNRSYLGFWTAPDDGTVTEKMRITSSGNVGIGTTSPSAKLDVAGTGNFTGLVSGITPVAAANFVTKAYVDGSGGGTGPFLPLAGGTMTGTAGVLMPDNFKLKFGDATTPNDLQIYHDGSNSYINDTGTGHLVLNTNGASMKFLFGSEFMAQFEANGSVDLYHNNVKKFETTSDGVTVTGGSSRFNVDSTTASAIDIGYYSSVRTIKAIETGGNNLRPLAILSQNFSVDSSGNGTFAGNITVGDGHFIGDDGDDNLLIQSSSGENLVINGAGRVLLQDGGSTKFETSSSGVTVTGSLVVSNDITATGDLSVRDIAARDLTLSGKGTSLATAASDGSTTLTTKSYVDGLVTGVPVYKGTWAAGTTGVTSAAINGTTITLTAAPTETIAIGDVVTADGITAAITVTAVGSQTSVTVNASVTIASGVTVTFSPEGGYPDLTLAAAKVLGNYYIVSTAGSAAPNGSGVEPDSWAVGDWCIFSDVTPGAGTDLWQRIDNSSVISGAGTGGTIPLWEGATNAVSETLTDSPITVSGNNTTFAGDITSVGLTVDYTGNRTGDAGVLVTNDNNDWGIKVDKDGTADYGILSQTDGENAIVVRNAAGVDKIQLQGDGDATFAGDVTISTSAFSQLDIITSRSGATDNIGGVQFYKSSTLKGQIFGVNDGKVKIATNGNTVALTLDESQNATFAGSINGGDINLSSTNNAIIDPLSVGNILRFTDNDPTQNNNQITGTIEWETKDSNNPGIQSFITTNSTNQGKGRLVFGTGLGGSAVEKMRIDSDGNVGIGTTSPGAKIDLVGGDVTGGLKISADKVTSAFFAFGADANETRITSTSYGGYKPLTIHTGGSERMRINSAGNVGIGITTPYTKLVIGSRGTASAPSILAYDGIAFDFYNDGPPYKRHGVIISQAADASESVLDFNTKAASGTNSTKMTILGNGNVGIGLIDPDEKLEIAGSLLLANNSDIKFNNSAGNKISTIRYNSSNQLIIANGNSPNGDIHFQSDVTSGLMMILDGATDYVGIGNNTSPKSMLDVQGGIKMADDTDTASADKAGTMRYRTGTEYVEVTGTELITNGDFTTDTGWTKGAGWTIANGVASLTAQGASSGLGSTVMTVTSGNIYKVVIDVISTSTGFRLYDTLGVIAYGLSVGKNTFYRTVTSSSYQVTPLGLSGASGSIESVSVVEVTAEDASYADMCMQTGSSTYEWVNIVRNTY